MIPKVSADCGQIFRFGIGRCFVLSIIWSISRSKTILRAVVPLITSKSPNPARIIEESPRSDWAVLYPAKAVNRSKPV